MEKIRPGTARLVVHDPRGEMEAIELPNVELNWALRQAKLHAQLRRDPGDSIYHVFDGAGNQLNFA